MNANEKRQQYMRMVKACEKADLYQDMVNYLTIVVEISSHFTKQEFDYFKSAFKNFIFPKRNSVRKLKDLRQKQKSCQKQNNLLNKKINQIQNQLQILCHKVIHLLQNTPIIIEQSGLESNLKVEAFKLLFISQLCKLKKFEMEQALQKYQNLYYSAKQLSPVNVTRMQTAYDYAVFLKEVAKRHVDAVVVGKKTFAVMVQFAERVSEEDFKQLCLIASILRDNLTLWTSLDQ